MPRYHFTSIFAAGLFATLFVFYCPWLFDIQSFYLTDITNHFEPTMKVLSEYWLKGQFQLWNPYAHCGEPQVAIPQPNLFYPPNWTFAYLSFNSALALNLMAHQFLAGMGNFLLVLSLSWGFAPAALAGMAAALSAYMFSLSTNYTLMASAAWLPLIIWSLRLLRVEKNRRWLHIVISTLSIACMILTGRPEIFAPALVLIAGYLAFAQWRADDKLSSIWPCLALLMGVMLAAPFILPTLEWQALSPRAKGLIAKEVLVWSANWYDFLGMLLPQPLGDLIGQGDKFLNLVAARPGYPPYLIAFVGPVIVALAIVGMFDTSWTVGLVISALLFVFLLLSAGDNLPFAPYLVANFPKLAILRFPVKLLFFPVWFLSLLAAHGLYLVLEKKNGKVSLAVNFSLWGSLLICAFLFPAYQNTVGILSAETLSNTVLKAGELICQSLIYMAAMAFILTLAIYLKQSGRLSRTAFLAIVFVGTFGLFVIHAFSFCYHAASADFFENKPTYLEKKLTALNEDCRKLVAGKESRLITLYFSGLLMPNKLLSGGESYWRDWPSGYYQYGRQILTPSTHFDRKFCSSFGYEGAETSDYRKLFVESFNKLHLSCKPFHRFCQITSTEYVFGMIDRLVRGKFVESDKLDEKYFQLLDEDRTYNVRIYKVLKPMPRIYMSYNWQKMSPDEALNTLINTDHNDFDPSRTTLISASVMPDTVLSNKFQEGKWQAEWLENSANSIAIKAKTDIPGFLVLTDHFYPGWRALVDGKVVSIYRANAVLRAVYLDKGEHTIQFKYEPDSLKFGCTISAIAGLALLLFACFLFRRRRP